MECFTLLLDHLTWIEHHFLSGIRDSRKVGSLWGMMRGVGGGKRAIHRGWLAKGLGLELLCWGFKVVQEEIPREEASTPQIESVAFPQGQYISPQLHLCHWLFDQDGHQDSSLVQSLLPVTFGYSLSSEVVVMRQLLRRKRLDDGDWHDHTRGLPLGLPDVVGTVQVYCSRRRLLRNWLEFHVVYYQ